MDFNRDAGNETASQLQLNIQNLNQQVIQLESFITNLSDSSESGQRERELFNRKAHNAQELSKETNALLKRLVVMSNSDKNLRGVRERLQNEYIGVLNRLQASQRKAAQTEKAGMVAAEMDAQAARDAAEYDMYGNNGRSGGQMQMTAQQQGNLQDMKERQNALQQLERDIGDVNAIFAELANIVHEQGDMVDSIEANVEHAQIYVEQYSTRMRKPFQKCLGRKSGKTEDIETGISPKRSTIRVIKSLPNTSLPPTPTAYTKPPVRRVHTNPVEVESPSRQFMFIYPKKPNYQSEQATFQSGSTRSSYLPERRSSQ